MRHLSGNHVKDTVIYLNPHVCAAVQKGNRLSLAIPSYRHLTVRLCVMGLRGKALVAGEL